MFEVNQIIKFKDTRTVSYCVSKVHPNGSIDARPIEQENVWFRYTNVSPNLFKIDEQYYRKEKLKKICSKLETR